jgi:hypothetical protein
VAQLKEKTMTDIDANAIAKAKADADAVLADMARINPKRMSEVIHETIEKLKAAKPEPTKPLWPGWK